MIISRTPLRISLGGGGTDLPFYSNKFGASLLTAAINKYIYITVSDRLDKKYKLNYSETEIVENIEDVRHPLIRECLKFVGVKKPLEIHSTAEIPAGSGLGSSLSFTVGLLNALYYYNGELVSKYKLAEDASCITMKVLKEDCGKQDQYAAAFGNLCNLKISPTSRVIVTPANISYENIKKLEKNLMLFYTGFTRSANDLLELQKKKAESNSDIILKYHEIKKIGEGSLKCLENGNLRKFGEWMHLHWELKRGISSKMSNSSIDNWYELSRANGVIGGKLIGAGGGGFLLLYVDKNHKRVEKVMNKQGLVKTNFKFDFEGSRIVYDGKYF